MFKKTTDSILSVFTKTIKQLEEHIAAQEAAHATLHIKIVEMTDQQDEIRADTAKADKALAKLKTFFE